MEGLKTGGTGAFQWTQVTVIAALSSEMLEQGGIPPGVIGTLVFRIEPDPKQTADTYPVPLTLSAEATAVGASSPMPADPTRFRDGGIFILKKAVEIQY